MITITRSMARLVRAVFRKALGITARGRLSTVLIEAGPTGLVFKARSFNVAAEYHVSGEHVAETLAVPYELLQDCEGSKEQPVRITLFGKGTIEAQWPDGSIPQVKQYVAGKADSVLSDYPPIPSRLSENPPGFLAALRDAADTSDPSPLRYSTNMIQLQGASGAIGATDGRHLLLQEGFAFPWEEDLLIPASKVFGSKELAGEEPALIGRTENWVTLCVGIWVFHFQIDKSGRYPRIKDHIQPAQSAQTRLRVSDADAQFLTQALDRLPCDDESHFAVTVELNGQAILRAKSPEQPRATELVLTGSSCSGAPLVIVTNRNYLARALKLGFREVLVFQTDRPVLCQDLHRCYAWAPLEPKDAIKSGKYPIRIESPAQHSTEHTQPTPQERKETMPRRKASDYGVAPANGNGTGVENGNTNETSNGAANGTTNGESAGEVSLIDQAEAVRASLREAGDKVGDLIVALKRHRKQSQLVKNTLSSLRQLQTLSG